MLRSEGGSEARQAVAAPISVMPNTFRIVSPAASSPSRMRGGHTAPATKPVRRVGRSLRPRPSRSAKSAGEPWSTVAPCALIASRSAPSEKVESTSTADPPDATAASRHGRPNACAIGTTRIEASVGSSSASAPSSRAPASRQAWLTSAPFGAPVVPEV